MTRSLRCPLGTDGLDVAFLLYSEGYGLLHTQLPLCIFFFFFFFFCFLVADLKSSDTVGSEHVSIGSHYVETILLAYGNMSLDQLCTCPLYMIHGIKPNSKMGENYLCGTRRDWLVPKVGGGFLSWCNLSCMYVHMYMQITTGTVS